MSIYDLAFILQAKRFAVREDRGVANNGGVMTTTIPDIEAYPKTILLRDGTPVDLRPLVEEDKLKLLSFFRRIPEEDRYYLKENVNSPEVIQAWTTNIDFGRVVPIVAVAGNEIVADATLHRSRSMARCHIGELRVVAEPAYRGLGLGRRLIEELLNIAAELGLHKVTFELVANREEAGIIAAASAGLEEVAT